MAIVTIEDVAHVAFAAPDLSGMARFLEDFGLQAIETGGRVFGLAADDQRPVHVTEQGDPRFVALGLRAASLNDLARLAEAEGVDLEDRDAPGGGRMVVLSDPDGNRVEVVAGQVASAVPRGGAARVWNHSRSRPRDGRADVSVPKPACITRLGHVVLDVADFRLSEAWYKARFGFITSDEIEAMPGHALGAFMRCDRGTEPTDHHTLFLLQHPNGPGFNHAAFEVDDLDDLMAGHYHLQSAGHTAHWGVGRHILGNQVFDYWRDPWGHVLEHWTDGDRLTAAHGSAKASVMDLLGVQWGPSMTMPS